MKDCIFCKIIQNEIKTERIFENDFVLVFPDAHPVAPIHLLVIPKQHVGELYKLKDKTVWNAILDALQQMIEENGLAEKGYKIEINGGGAQLVNHLHVHLLGPVGHPKIN